jgi:hypothetical protein
MITGCATLSESECIYGDWYQIGLSDGRFGYMASRVEKHRKACQKVNTPVDLDAYMSGRDEGLRYYCTSQNAFDSGLNGNYYNNVCPLDMELDFIEHYNYGKEIYEIRSQISSLESKIDIKENEIEDANTSDEDRKYLRREIRGMFKDLSRLNQELLYLETKYSYLL